jgi:hypothetical protein
MLREIGKTIKILKFDKWNEFCNDFSKKIGQEECQAHELTYAYIPKQNGAAKFRNKITLFFI